MEGCVGGINYCGTIFPAPTSFECLPGYTRTSDLGCVLDKDKYNRCPAGASESGNSCGPEPTTCHPIGLKSGQKLLKGDDFATADGRFVISRSYNSLPFGVTRGFSGNDSLIDFPWGLSGNWQFDFLPELHLGESADGTTSSPFYVTMLLA